jgi:hypothetical protein
MILLYLIAPKCLVVCETTARELAFAGHSKRVTRVTRVTTTRL